MSALCAGRTPLLAGLPGRDRARAVQPGGVQAETRQRPSSPLIPEIEQWASGGHSLGGAMPRTSFSASPTPCKGCSRAAYPASNNSLAAHSLPVVSIYGTNDRLASNSGKARGAAACRPVMLKSRAAAMPRWAGTARRRRDGGDSSQAQQAQIVEATVRCWPGWTGSVLAVGSWR